MSQRAKASVEAHGGVDAVVAAAQARNVHLVLLTDDHGRELVVASLAPLTILC